MKLTTVNRRAILFIGAILLQLAAFILMSLDSSPHGFSSLSLDVAPALLMAGIVLPIFALSTSKISASWIRNLIKDPVKSIGFILSFLVALVTYVFTLEPTASIWDCSETIATAFKLQVPHTPGTPLTLLFARLFSMLALGDVYQVAWFINFMSALFSALAIGIIFLISWDFGKKVIQDKWVILIGSLGGAFSLTFSDTFWFSAVEAETYGPSIFFMVLLIWLSSKGCLLDEKDRSIKLLQLSYLVGLSYCIHPMCILILPVCVLVWRFHTRSFTWKQVAISVGIGVGIILFISKVIAVDLFEWAFQLDLFLVNKWSFPFYSGVIVLVFLLAAIGTFLWIRVQKSRFILQAVLMILFGFTPYLMLFIRSAKLPPINEFTPNNLAKIKPYMNRESYPSRPLMYGPYFDAKIEDTSPKASSYVVKDDHYEEVGTVPAYHYTKDRMTILPRMYSNEPSHIKVYRQWTGLQPGEEPGFLDNLKFMIRYQLGEMYMRYLMWNFAGRAGDVMHSDWLSPWQGMADRSAISYSKGTNQYFMLPLILGILGILIQFKRDRQGFVTSLLFFLITGFLLAIYLNATPNEPRERDYIFVGSFVAFSVWIGLGIMRFADLINRKELSYGLAVVSLSVPFWMLYQNLDDHNRSDRTFQLAHARSVLDSCEKNAILFTGGDNDTFPLWYLQDVEGFRTDVRVKVMSYFNADWYINQLSREYYESPPAKLTLMESQNQYGPYNPLYIYEKTKAPILFDKYMEALIAKNPQLMLSGRGEEAFFYLPSRHLDIPTSKGEVEVTINGNYLPKSELAILDLISSNDWNRPIYFNFTGLNSLTMDLRRNMIQEGLVYRLNPEMNPDGEIPLDLEKSYENLMKKGDYTNLGNEAVYFNHEDYESRMIMPIKFAFNSLIKAYLDAGQHDKAKELVKFARENLYHDHLESSYADIQLAGAMKLLDMNEEASKLVHRTFEFFDGKISNQLKLDDSYAQNDLLILQEATRFLQDPQTLANYQTLVDRIKDSL